MDLFQNQASRPTRKEAEVFGGMAFSDDVLDGGETLAAPLSEEQIREYNTDRPKEDHTEIDLIIDFYHRFLYRMEYMMRVGREKGYDLISFMGP